MDVKVWPELKGIYMYNDYLVDETGERIEITINNDDEMSAKEEFINHVESVKRNDKKISVTSAIIILKVECEDNLAIILNPNYSNSEYNNFLEKLKFEYDHDYGIQGLYGYIWYNNGAWSARIRDDGHEWWEYKEYPSFYDKLELIDYVGLFSK